MLCEGSCAAVCVVELKQHPSSPLGASSGGWSSPFKCPLGTDQARAAFSSAQVAKTGAGVAFSSAQSSQSTAAASRKHRLEQPPRALKWPKDSRCGVLEQASSEGANFSVYIYIYISICLIEFILYHPALFFPKEGYYADSCARQDDEGK